MKWHIFLYVVLSLFITNKSYSQDLEDFYKRRGLGTYVSYTTFKCTSPAYEKLHLTDPEKYNSKYSQFSFPLLLVLDLPEAVNARKWGFHYQGRLLLSTDLWGSILGKQKTSHALTSFINMRLGLNFFSNDQLVVRGGLGGGIWWFSAYGSVYDSISNTYNQHSDFPFTFGPYIGADYAITDWLAARVIGEYCMGTVLNNNGDGKQKYPSPKIWVWNFELFTTPGFFIALDLYRMPKVKDYISNNGVLEEAGTSFKYSRTDILLGWKFRFKN